MSDFLDIAGKAFLIFGVANRKSVAYHVGKTLEAAGAEVLYVVRSEERRQQLKAVLGADRIFVCDVEFEDQIERLRSEIAATGKRFHGLLHSIAFADYSGGMRPFYETGKRQMSRTFEISCYSLIAVANAFKDLLDPDASVVTVSISTTRMASENYGFMAPIKAALDSSVVFLAKSFSSFSRIRFNAVSPGLLKTSASAGIPGYVDSYLFAEQIIPRKKAVQTQEAANAAAFLLSPRSSGINAQSLVVDAGMSINYFDADVVRRAMRPE
jgi:enoyl-[acyl-carrier protein] reductase I